MRPCGERGGRGVALLEAVVALAILGLAIVSIVESASSALRAQAAGRRHREAVLVADARLGELAAAPAESLRAFVAGRDGAATLGGRRYRWRVQAVAADDSTEVWRVAVTVAWDEAGAARDGRVVLVSAVYRPRTRLPGSALR